MSTVLDLWLIHL